MMAIDNFLIVREEVLSFVDFKYAVDLYGYGLCQKKISYHQISNRTLKISQ